MMFILRVIALLLLATAAQAASFDCKKASTAVEHLICADEDLSALDEALSMVYKFELADDANSDAIRSAQRSWQTARNQCTDAACLTLQYEQRITQLCDNNTRATGSAIGVNGCAFVQLRVAEQQLEQLEQQHEAASLAEAENVNAMRKMIADERAAWKAYRNARCALVATQEGGMPAWQAAYANLCTVQETKARIKVFTE